MSTTYLPESEPPDGLNPYHRYHLLAYVPLLLITTASGGLGSAQVYSHLGWFIVTSAVFIIATFIDFMITDRLLARVERTWFYRLMDAYLPLLLVLSSAGVTLALEEFSDYSAGGRVVGIALVSVVLFAVVIGVREIGSLGRVVKPKTIAEMEPEVAMVLPRITRKPNHCRSCQCPVRH